MTALGDALDQIRDHISLAYAESDITDPPGRIYVSPGAPPADCELVAVWGVPRLKEATGLTDPRMQRCVMIHQADITIRSWLCVPTGTPPIEAALDAAGLRVANHLFAVWWYLGRQIVNQTLLDGVTCTGAQLINASQILDEDGAFVGWQIEARVDLTPLLHQPAAS